MFFLLGGKSFLGEQKKTAGQHSPGRNVGETNRFWDRKKSPRQGNTHPDAMLVKNVVFLRKKKPPAGQHSPGRNVFIHRCIHMYAYCIHIDVIV